MVPGFEPLVSRGSVLGLSDSRRVESRKKKSGLEGTNPTIWDVSKPSCKVVPFSIFARVYTVQVYSADRLPNASARFGAAKECWLSPLLKALQYLEAVAYSASH